MDVSIPSFRINLNHVNFRLKNALFMFRSSHLSAMLAIGNKLSNSVYEANITNGTIKPLPQSPREEKENWIRRKYEAKEFVCEANAVAPIGKQLIEAVVR